MFQNNTTFFNFTDKDFVYPWANASYTFKAGKKYSVPEDAAKHFAKHLAQFVLNTTGRDSDQAYSIDPMTPNLKALYDKALPSDVVAQPFEAIEYAEEKPEKVKKTKDEENLDEK